MCGACFSESEALTTETIVDGDIDENVVIVEVNDDDVENNRNDKEVYSNEQKETAKNQSKLCKFFKHGKCKYGSKGNDCSYDHPKKCFKFVQNGDKSSRGCKKGKECDYYHPPLCKDAMRTKKCNRKDCKFLHMKGTKFGNGIKHDEQERDLPRERVTNYDRVPIEKASVPTQPGRWIQPEMPSYASVVRHQRTPHLMDGEQHQSRCDVNGTQSQTVETSFQNMRNQLQQMQAQLQMLIRASSQTVTKMCHCQASFQQA